MQINKLRTKQVDNFFYKYFNDNIKDESFIDKIKDTTYIEVYSQFHKFAIIGEIDINKFSHMLYTQLSKNNILKDEQRNDNKSDK